MTSKLDLYNIYKKQFEEQKRDYVTASKFNELWNAIFPQHLLRPWVGIPGKCDPCLLIYDKMSDPKSSKAVKEACRELHLLHRGGMFMPERNW
jgi:hypothetical protein